MSVFFFHFFDISRFTIFSAEIFRYSRYCMILHFSDIFDIFFFITIIDDDIASHLRYFLRDYEAFFIDVSSSLPLAERQAFAFYQIFRFAALRLSAIFFIAAGFSLYWR